MNTTYLPMGHLPIGINKIRHTAISVVRMLFACLAIVITTTGCKQNMSADELKAQYGSGVVMVVNSYYYKVELPTKSAIYFTGVAKDGTLENFTYDEKDIKKKSKTMSATGFVVSESGKVLAPLSVADLGKDKDKMAESVSKFLKKRVNSLSDKSNKLNDKYTEASDDAALMETMIYSPYTQIYGPTLSGKYNSIEAANRAKQKFENQIEKISEELEKLVEYGRPDLMGNTLDADMINVSMVSNISVVFDGTSAASVAKETENNLCDVADKSDDKSMPLCLLQIKSQKVPSGTKVLAIPSDKPDAPESGSRFSMIGFDKDLSAKDADLSESIVGGTFTGQNYGGNPALDIKAAPAMSGSPMFDNEGNLVGMAIITDGDGATPFCVTLDKLYDFAGK